MNSLEGCSYTMYGYYERIVWCIVYIINIAFNYSLEGCFIYIHIYMITHVYIYIQSLLRFSTYNYMLALYSIVCINISIYIYVNGLEGSLTYIHIDTPLLMIKFLYIIIYLLLVILTVALAYHMQCTVYYICNIYVIHMQYLCNTHVMYGIYGIYVIGANKCPQLQFITVSML